jgi:hypothetical protein
MVSSSVFGQEALLDQIYATLIGYGYEVWMSHKGTIPTHPGRSNFDNCLHAVRDCAALLALITGRYGSGRTPGDLSITHREILRAIELAKPAWFLVHHDVEVARQLLKQFRFNDDGTPKALTLKSTPILEDARILDMYEAALKHDVPLSDRIGNWVQPYSAPEDVLRYVEAQFSNSQRVKHVCAEIAGRKARP